MHTYINIYLNIGGAAAQQPRRVAGSSYILPTNPDFDKNKGIANLGTNDDKNKGNYDDNNYDDADNDDDNNDDDDNDDNDDDVYYQYHK
jgi:hypothetical protein